jgi:hypothetical protein
MKAVNESQPIAFALRVSLSSGLHRVIDAHHAPIGIKVSDATLV